MDNSNIVVLIVDDENIIRNNLRVYLEDEGYEVFTADSGEDGIKILKEKGMIFNIGIIDMRLPGMDGNAFILQAHEIQPKMKFLIHTGSVNYKLPDTFQSIGIHFQHVFQKPLDDMSILANAITNLLQDKPVD